VDGLIDKFYETFKGKHPSFYNYSIKKKRINASTLILFINHFLLLKPDKDTTKKENCRPIPLINLCIKIFSKILQTEFKDTFKKSYTVAKLISFPGFSNVTVQHTQINKHNTAH
jgi:hypothetical protein